MATILVGDDKELNRSVLTTLLGYTGHRLLEAATGPEALDKVRTLTNGLILEQSVIRAANHLSEKLNISLGAKLDEHQQQNTSC